MGEVITRNYFIHCNFVKVSKFSKKKSCCKFLKHCIGKHCQNTKLSCHFSGHRIYKKNKKAVILKKKHKKRQKKTLLFMD